MTRIERIFTDKEIVKYFFRLSFHILKLSGLSFELGINGREIWAFSLVIMGYVGSMAIFSLASSTIWKKINNKEKLNDGRFYSFCSRLLPIVVFWYVLVKKCSAVLFVAV